jgi:hypothetical protein
VAPPYRCDSAVSATTLHFFADLLKDDWIVGLPDSCVQSNGVHGLEECVKRGAQAASKILGPGPDNQISWLRGVRSWRCLREASVQLRSGCWAARNYFSNARHSEFKHRITRTSSVSADLSVS